MCILSKETILSVDGIINDDDEPCRSMALFDMIISSKLLLLLLLSEEEEGTSDLNSSILFVCSVCSSSSLVSSWMIGLVVGNTGSGGAENDSSPPSKEISPAKLIRLGGEEEEPADAIVEPSGGDILCLSLVFSALFSWLISSDKKTKVCPRLCLSVPFRTDDERKRLGTATNKVI